MEKIPGLDKPILKITYKVLNRWFSLQGKSVNDNKMSHFKNIGSWLGKMTISQGMPIPLHRLNLKNILISSFKIRNRIHSDVPVIIKILEYLNKHPEIFRSSSPWLSRLLSALH
jgi:CCR4-NOT transcription complex subunit 1